MTPGAAWLSALPPFLVAAGVCIVAVPLSMVLARRVGAVAHPDDERHLHAAPTPRLGGLAMLLGYVVALAVFGGQIQSRWPLLAVAGVVTLVMAVDDVVDVVWWQKLIVVLGAGVAFCALGLSITSVDLPGIGMVNLGLLALPLTVLWVAGMQVSVNFMDGADGVAAGVVAIVALVAMLAAINRIIVPGDLQSGVVILSASLMGVCAGFLIFNLPPARTFMGDTGSHFLGVVLAAITIVGIAKVAVGLSILVPLIALGLPISDTAWAIVRRGRTGRDPCQWAWRQARRLGPKSLPSSPRSRIPARLRSGRRARPQLSTGGLLAAPHRSRPFPRSQLSRAHRSCRCGPRPPHDR